MERCTQCYCERGEPVNEYLMKMECEQEPVKRGEDV